MVLMIFKFYLESGEHGFFIKRLKNVALAAGCRNKAISTPERPYEAPASRLRDVPEKATARFND